MRGSDAHRKQKQSDGGGQKPQLYLPMLPSKNNLLQVFLFSPCPDSMIIETPSGSMEMI
jgi:hypothetical protein